MINFEQPFGAAILVSVAGMPIGLSNTQNDSMYGSNSRLGLTNVTFISGSDTCQRDARFPNTCAHVLRRRSEKVPHSTFPLDRQECSIVQKGGMGAGWMKPASRFVRAQRGSAIVCCEEPV